MGEKLIIAEIIALAILLVAVIIRQRTNNKSQNCLTLIISLAEIFINYASQYLTNKSGMEKMDFVSEKLYTIAMGFGLKITKEEITKIAQTVYDTLKEKCCDEKEQNNEIEYKLDK